MATPAPRQRRRLTQNTASKARASATTGAKCGHLRGFARTCCSSRARDLSLFVAADMLLSPLRFPHNQAQRRRHCLCLFLRAALCRIVTACGGTFVIVAASCDELNAVFPVYERKQLRQPIDMLVVFCSYMRYYYNLSYTTQICTGRWRRHLPCINIYVYIICS